MSTTNEIEPAPSDEKPLKKHVVLEIELTPSDQKRPVVAPPHSQPKHKIFLSHSGAQKDFVEQLYEDLKRSHHSTFFDKSPDSLPKGEKFAQEIFQAAQQCEVGIVVVSEEYFSRSKWPMLELAEFVHASKCKILPLFFELSCDEFKLPAKQERWFQKWAEWAKDDPRVRVEEWKHALREVGASNGVEYVKAMGEVRFRKEVVAHVGNIMPKKWPDPPIRRWEGLLVPLIILKVIGVIIIVVIFVSLFTAIAHTRIKS